MTPIKEKTINLTEAEKIAIDKLMAALKADWPSTKFKLFGSKVNGTFDEESDLDILIMLPCPVTNEIRRQIVHKVSDINLSYETNISALIVSEKEWQSAPLNLLPIHYFIEEEGISL